MKKVSLMMALLCATCAPVYAGNVVIEEDCRVPVLSSLTPGKVLYWMDGECGQVGGGTDRANMPSVSSTEPVKARPVTDDPTPEEVDDGDDTDDTDTGGGDDTDTGGGDGSDGDNSSGCGAGSGGGNGDVDDDEDRGRGNASANNGKGGNYDKTGHEDNGKGNGKGRR